MPVYLTERLILLYAMGHTANGHYLEALKALNYSFTDRRLLKKVDATIAYLLMEMDDDQASLKEKTARYQWLAFSARHEPQSSLFKCGLMGAATGNRIMLEQLNTFELLTVTGASQLINYDEVLTLGKQALQSLMGEQTPEHQLLTLLLEQSDYDAVTVNFFWICPAFHTTLKQQYDQTTKFRILEDYLLNPVKIDSNKLLAPVDSIQDRHVQTYLNNRQPSIFKASLQAAKETVLEYVERPFIQKP